MTPSPIRSRVLGFVLGIYFGCPVTAAYAAATEFLDRNSSLRVELSELESHATSSVRKEIALLRGTDASQAANAARRLRNLGPAARGATGALLQSLRFNLPRLAWCSESTTGQVCDSSRTTTLSEIAADALVSIGPQAVRPLVYALTDESQTVREAAWAALKTLADPRAPEIN